MEYNRNRAWAEINLDNIAHNVREIRRVTSNKAELMGVVKADAYGHGVIQVSRVLLENGVTRLAVATLDEAIQLRKNNFDVPVLILGYTDPARAAEILEYDITQTVFGLDLAEALSDAAVKTGRKAKIHIKVDTGMTRIGFMPGESAVKEIGRINRLPGITIEGMFTHFSSADEKDESYTRMQFEKFLGIDAELNRAGITIPIKHAANSAAIIRFPETHMDLVRPGLILYGLYPSDETNTGEISLKPAMSLKADVIRVENVSGNTPVSYGRRFVTSRESRIATIPVGYADGYSRLLSGKSHVLINGQRFPVVGSVCMDQCMADVTGAETPVKAGDEAVLIGRQGEDEITADELASLIGTINYEVVSQVNKRVPRFYTENGRISGVLNYLV
jgi:alanine racemase